MEVENQPDVSGAEEVSPSEAQPASAGPDPYKGTIFEGQSFEVEEETKPEPTAAEGAEPGPSATEPPAPQLHKVKVRGEELEVPYEELVNGYSRQEDYTRSKQEIAEDRRLLQPFIDLQDAMSKDPKRVIQALATQYGVTFGEAAHAVDNGWDWTGESTEQEQPTELEQRLARLETVENQRAVDAETQAHLRTLKGLHEQFGDFDDVELVQHAQRHGHPNLVSAYRDLHWDRAMEQAKTAQDAQREAATQAVVDSKREAQVVEGGASKAPGAVKQPEPSFKDMDFRQVANETLKQLGIRS